MVDKLPIINWCRISEASTVGLGMTEIHKKHHYCYKDPKKLATDFD